MNLYDLFLRCITIPYKQVGISANYAFEIIDRVLYIYFEDSSGLNDWLKNINFIPTFYKVDKKFKLAHKGFVSVWEEIKPYLENVILNKKIQKIVITGYSHGAGVSVLCYEYLIEKRKDIKNKIKGYGFGCPRVLFGFYKKLQKRYNNFVVIRNIDDIVTHLPPFFFGFIHIGKLIKIGEKGKYTKIDAHREVNILRELNNFEKQS